MNEIKKQLRSVNAQTATLPNFRVIRSSDERIGTDDDDKVESRFC